MLKPILFFRFASLSELYYDTVRTRNLKFDQQQLTIAQLQRLNDQLVSTHSAWRKYAATIADQPNNPTLYTAKINNKDQNNKKQGGFFGFFKKDFSSFQGVSDNVRGIYLYGGSGCGKSFLSELFYAELKIAQKKREHFHEFMSGVHAQLFDLQRSKKGYDPLVKVAARRAAQTRLLYLDEFQVTDVADASILRRLFQNLLARGVILLATSNRHPTDLYKNGHQRQFFLPFIDLLQQKCDIVHLQSQDYRLSLQKSTDTKDTTYLEPINDTTNKRFLKIFNLATHSKGVPQFKSIELEPVKGRKLIVHKAVGNVCFFEFEELMDAIMGDTDFRIICKHFRAIFVRGMRKIDSNQRNVANRLIKLFDEAYFRHVKIYILADTPLQKLIVPPTKPQNQQDFALVRCQSRLIQFQTKSYKQALSFSEKPDEP